jgi:hypothetical protein
MSVVVQNVVAKSYSRYDVNGFCFCSTVFEASRPLVATTNIEVVTRAVDVDTNLSTTGSLKI